MSETAAVDFISAGEELILNAIREDAFFQNIQTLKDANGDIGAQIDEALGKLGIFLIVRVKNGPVPKSASTEEWDAVIVVTENPLLNRTPGSTGKTARMVVHQLVKLFQESAPIYLETATGGETGDGFVVWTLKAKVLVGLVE